MTIEEKAQQVVNDVPGEIVLFCWPRIGISEPPAQMGAETTTAVRAFCDRCKNRVWTTELKSSVKALAPDRAKLLCPICCISLADGSTGVGNVSGILP